jgi:tetratricopeptide (TPR) repeat protein
MKEKSSFFRATRASSLVLLTAAAVLLTAPRTRAEESGDYWDKADAEFEAGNYQAAADDYDKGLKLDPDHPGIWNHLGTCYLNLHRYEDALAAFEKEISVAGSDSIAHEGYDGLGEAYADMKQFQKALDAYNHAIAIDPDDAEAYEGRAEVYKALGQSAKAQQDRQKAKRLTAKES